MNDFAKGPALSVLIPAYEMNGIGEKMLSRALTSIKAQVLLPQGALEVVVSDHSEGYELERVCEKFRAEGFAQITYLRKTWDRDSPSSSLNYAFSRSNGSIIKILFLDDFLIRHNALASILSIFHDRKVMWLACGTLHTRDGVLFEKPHLPSFHSNIQHGRNTLSSPSVVALRREAWEPFDSNLLWLMDVDFYKRLSLKHGQPLLLNELLIATGLGPHQATNRLVPPLKKMREHLYVFFKYLLRD